MRNIRVYDKILKKYIPFNGCYSFEDPTLVFEEGTCVRDATENRSRFMGNEIFVGDIVSGVLNNQMVVGDIKYDSVSVTYMVGGAKCHSVTLKELFNVKIIGNIHETPRTSKILMDS